jgi:hypothetical protein
MSPPSYRIQIVKSLGAEQWSNDYLTDHDTLTLAENLATQLVTFEQKIHMAVVKFDYVRISTFLPGDRIFRHIPLNLTGLVNTVEYIPLYNTLRVDFQTASSDPARKYYRCPISEADQQNGAFISTYLSGIALTMFTYLDDPGLYGDIVTTAGNKVITASHHGDVQMRQLHRHKRKKVAVN